MRQKRAKWFIPTAHNAVFTTITVDGSNVSKSNFAKCRVLLRGANGMPLICQISWHPCANALKDEVNANLEG
jgi:hypothetical protein